MKKIILLISVILFIGIIYIFSNFRGEISDNQSIGLLEHTVGKIVVIFDNDITDEEMSTLYLKLNYPLRKIVHIIEFFVLSLMICLFLECFNIKFNNTILLTFIICLLVACFDEIHQLYVVDRYGCLFDVFVDSIGIILFLVIYYFKKRGKKYD